jgi:hypothetical protein
MIRRTRQQIERESALISGAFNEIRTLSGSLELEDGVLKEELSAIVLERVGEGAFNEVQKRTLWQVATQDDVDQLKEKYLPMKQSAEDLVDDFKEMAVAQKSVSTATAEDVKIGISQEERRDSETKSDHSNKISLNLLSSRIGKLSQTLGFGINRQNGKVEFEVEFGT